MLDLNHLLLFIAILSPLVLLARTWRLPETHRDWRWSAISVLIVTAGAFLLARPFAGFIGGGAWFALLLVPAVALRKITDLGMRQKFGTAYRLARWVQLLHPSRGLREQADVLHALECAKRGDRAGAGALLARVARGSGDHARHARAQSFRMEGDWAGLRSWFETELPRDMQQTDFGLLPLYLRALGEVGVPDEMVAAFAARAPGLLAHPQHATIFNACLLPVLAFTGRKRPLGDLLATTFKTFNPQAKEYWMATAEIARGDSETGRKTLEAIRATSADGLLRLSAETRLRAPGIPVALAGSTEQLLRPFERHRGVGTGPFGDRANWPTTGVFLLIAINLVMFAIELTQGGSTNPRTLHRLGQLEPSAIRYTGEYWRMGTALFLHYGPLHLAFNLYALWVIGPGLERAIGLGRFLFSYLLTGLGSSAGVVILRMVRVTSAEQLVGASGCVMGLVGVWVGSLIRHRHAPFASQRLRSILLIVVIQTAFDLWTPQISMAAHLSGLGIGVLLGWLIVPRRLRV